MKTLIIVIALVGLAIGIRAYNIDQATKQQISPVASTQSPDTQKNLISQFSKSEYLEIAIKNCSEEPDVTESYCRCFYSEMLDVYTVEEVYDLDKQATDNVDSLKLNSTVTDIVTRCYVNNPV